MLGLSTGRRLAQAALFVVLLVTGVSSDGRAQEGPWTVSEVAGAVRVMPIGGRAVALSVGDVVPPGAEIETGADARLVLNRGEASITVAPVSRLSLPETPSAGLTTTIVQQLGTLLLRVNRRPQQHFEVRTPFLAAVVKGTTFTVSVDSDGAAVHVVEGLVEVNDIDTGQTALVRPGQTATTSSEAGSGLSVGDGSGSDGTPDQRGAVEPDEEESAPGKSEDAPGQVKKAAAETDDDSATGNGNGKAVGLTIKEALIVETADVSALTSGLVNSAAAPVAGVGANGNGQGNAFGAANGNNGLGALVSQSGGNNGNNGNGNNGNNGNGNNGNNGNGNNGNNGNGNNGNNGNGNNGNNGNGNNGNGNNGNNGNGNNGNGNGNS